MNKLFSIKYGIATLVLFAGGVLAASESERSITMFMAMNGRPTFADVERKLSALAAGGIDSFMLYPVSGLKLDYLGN